MQQISAETARNEKTSVSRRRFLSILGGAGLGTLAALSAPGFTRFLEKDDSFDLLVVGDSLIWGQGLREQDKSYTLLADRLRKDAFGTPRKIDLKVKAHSGATIKFHPEDAEKYRKVGRDETFNYAPEINVSTPSIWKQIEVAASEYKASGNDLGADLILVSGGATDISVAAILDPSGDNSKLSADIERYCHRDMLDVIRQAARMNPSGLIAVVGYFPLITRDTKSSKLLNAWLELRSFPRIFKPFVNNPVARALYFKKVRKHAQIRSAIWYRESTKSLQTAVADLNRELGGTRAVFVPSPIGEDAAFETPNSLLYSLEHNHPNDALFAERKAQCRSAIPALKKEVGISIPFRYCEDAAIGHPTPAGARAYADAIERTVRPFVTAVRS